MKSLSSLLKKYIQLTRENESTGLNAEMASSMRIPKVENVSSPN